MTWRKTLTALSIAALFAAVDGSVTPAFASPDKAVLLAGLQADQATVRGLVIQVGEMVYLGTQRTAFVGDLSAADAAVAALYQQTLIDTSARTLIADSHRFGLLHRELRALEVSKIDMAWRVNNGNAELDVLTRRIQLSGGMNPKSPIHSQVRSMLTQMGAAKSELDQAVGHLYQATFGNYPASLGLLPSAHSLIDRAFAILFVVNQAVRQLQVPHALQKAYYQKTDVYGDFSVLNQLRARVFGDANLNRGERGNLLGQINTDIIALGQLNRCLALGAPDKCVDEATKLEQLDAGLLIRPKAEIMLAGAADRSADTELTSLLPILQAGIAAAAATHDITKLSSLLSDMKAQLAGASADIAPIDSELEPLTTFPAAQRSQDLKLMQTALGTVADANKRLAAAGSDASQIEAALA